MLGDAGVPGVPWQMRRPEVRGVLGFDEVGAARELPSPDRGFSDSDSPSRRRRRRQSHFFPRNPGASTVSSGLEGDDAPSAGASSRDGDAGGAGDSDAAEAGFLWNSTDDLLWSEDERVLLPMPGSGGGSGFGRRSPDL